MRGSFGRWLSIATIAMLGALALLGLTLGLGLARADRLLDRSGRSQAQLALAYRLEADSSTLMAPDAALRRQAAAALDADLADYRASILAETGRLAASARASQATEAARAADLARVSHGMERETGEPLAADTLRFRAIVRAIVVREQAEAEAALGEMRRLRGGATAVAIMLPLALAIMAGWFVVAMRRGLVHPLGRLRAAAAAIGSGDADAGRSGFDDFEPLADAIRDADREIVRQRRALSQTNHRLETQVADRTAALARRNRRLAQIDATRRLFFSQVGHELRTPVTVIRGEAEVVLRDTAASPARLREALDHIVVTGAFLGRRIDDLLAVARAEDGRLTIDRARIDLVAVAVAVEAVAAPYAASAGVTLTLDRPGSPLPIDGDASWLQQALLALIDNAVRHATRGGGGILLSVGASAGSIVATVSDDGPGVAAELLPRLFDAWSQADGAVGGSGLGLAVSRWVAEAHGGTIAAHNAPEGGLVVGIRLPVA